MLITLYIVTRRERIMKKSSEISPKIKLETNICFYILNIYSRSTSNDIIINISKIINECRNGDIRNELFFKNKILNF